MFVEANASFISVVQAVCFSSGSNTLRKRLFMSHPKHVFCLASCPSSTSFLRDGGPSSFRGSDGCSGQNSIFPVTQIRSMLSSKSLQ